jgi:hypothetical protein
VSPGYFIGTELHRPFPDEACAFGIDFPDIPQAAALEDILAIFT